MATWTIYSKEGVAKCTVKQLEYSGEWMGECFVTVKIESPEPISLAIGDYLDYRGERFYLNYDPTVSKTARKYSYGKAFTYDGIKFNNASDELTRCSFLDTVVGDNQQHYTALPTFSFFASSVNALAERIQANLDRVYTEADGNKWTVSVAEDFTGETDVNVEVNNITVWGALELCVSLFNANFIIRGRTITIGAAGIPAANVFKYGKGNGLRSIERTAEQDQQVITRLRAYGSTRNLPARYYHEKSGGTLPGTLAVDRLMLPGFPEETFDPYLDSKNISSLGIREATVFFDGTDGREEIYPTLEGMTDSEGNRIDQVVDAEQITDNGVPPETAEEQEAMQSTFTVTLRDLGFDLNDHLAEGQTAILTMQSGMCASREFEITECAKEGSGYKLTCLRQLDEALNLYFPYKDYNIKAGDEFTFAGIDLPDVYIEQASQRLKTAAQKFLSKNDYVRYSYTPEVDNLYMARQHDQAMQSGGLIKSLHDTLKEGDILLFEDDDLGIDASVVIDQLVIKEGGKVPEYTAYGKDLFLSRTFNDTASGLITFLRGWQSRDFAAGMTGTGIGTVNGSELHADKLLARKYIEVLALVVAQMFYRGGRQVLSPAGMKVSKVEEREDCWRLYMETGDGQVNTFTVGAQARVNRYGAEQRYWWRLVTAVGADYIDVSKADCDEGSVAPAIADEVVQVGHRTDPQLQWCVMDSSFSEDAGRTIYAGIDSYTLEGKLVLREGVDPNDPGRIGLFLPDGTEISTVIGDLQQQIDDFGEGLRMEIDAEEGNLVIDGEYDGDLVATVWRQWKDITSTVTRWVWTRQSGTDTASLASDALWNDEHAGVNAGRINIQGKDIVSPSVKFVCDATVGDATVRGVFG